MRKLLLLITGAFSCSVLMAQLTEPDIILTKQLVSKNAKEIGFSQDDLSNYTISSSYLSAEGIRMVYLYQSYKDIPVYNQMHVLAFSNEKLVSVAGGRIPGFEKRVNNLTGIPSLSPGQAVLAAISDSDIPLQKISGSVSDPVLNNYGKLDFGKLGVASENITAELFWYPAGEKDYRLVWQVFLAPEGKSDMWSVKVDAATGEILGKYNYTVYCNWHRDDQSALSCDKTSHTLTIPGNKMNEKQISIKPFEWKMPVVNSAAYKVVQFPAESPLHPGGAPSLHVDPWLLAPGNATTLKWHNDGTADHDSTRGNNVWAAEDRNNTNNVMDKAAVSQTPQPNLSFDYVPDFTQSPLLTTPPNQQFNITNLFYTNNIIHDLVYQYGFNEVSGNFQNDNLGRGGLGTDYVIADAQDGGGTNNANFATPVDGTKPRMQMYIWTAANPDRDGDVDNGIIVHEFGHGISNRLTGGPANSSCVGNAEHGGEGWSDYYALMANTNWATATINDGPNPRPIGTYAANQSPTGPGIRNYPYSTSLAINPLVYSTTLPSQAHNRGEYWCEALWEMTWALIQQSGINPNIFNAAGVGGNSASLKLVTEGMKLQPCSPGFIDARDAILKADTLFFGAQYSCAIWTAFAKRGMGRGASQGSSNSVTDQVPSFIISSADIKLTESVPVQLEGSNVTYTNTVTAHGCGAISNFYITDTLPTNVTYVSGGSYNAGNRTVTFSPVNLAASATQTFPFTVTINNGTYFAPITHLNEPVAGATIPATWTATSINTTVWTVATSNGHSLPNSFAAIYNVNAANDLSLTTTNQYVINPNTVSNYTTLSFWHQVNTEEGWDGGVVEISTNNGSTWSDLGSKMVKNGYNGSLGTGSNLSGRAAFTGTIPGFIETVVNLSAYAGQSIKIRFRFASDNNTGALSGTSGWWVDDIVIYSEPAVQMRSNLFNAANVRQSFSDTLTRIIVGCAPVTITAQPANANGCIGGSTTFSVTVNGTTPAYQWQLNTGSGFSDLSNNATYAGVNTATLTVSNITAGMNGYLYRVVLGNGCTATFNSNSATLNVGAVATINSHPTSVSVCPGVNVNFSVGATNATSYQWQVNTGSGFVDIVNNPPYSGATTATLTITNVTVGMNTYQYRAVVGSCPSALTSNAASLQVSTPVTITAQPANITACEGDGTTFSVTVNGTVTSYQWYLSTDNGVTYNPISGAASASYSLTNLTTLLSGNRYRVIITGPCGSVTSNAGILTVNPLPVFTLGTLPSSVCNSDPAITLTAVPSGGVWSGGPGVSGSTFTPSQANLGSNIISYTLTASGCSRTQSATILVNECSGRHLLLSNRDAVLIYPNPNAGVFSLGIRTDLYKNLGVKVFDSHGRLVKSFFFGTATYGTIIPIRLTTLEDGVYHLYLYNQENGFISRGASFIIQN